MSTTSLIIGASGQIGTELTKKLRATYGENSVIASDIRDDNTALVNSGPFKRMDAMDYNAIKDCVTQYNVDTVYLMAAMLSATGEKYPEKAWHLNMTSLFNVLNLAKEGFIKKIFWPSSIAVFGPTTPREQTPQYTIMEPTTVYGITKQVGERWCEYYFNNYGVDVRSIRYPGIISWKTLPGGGTTDYAIDIYHKALETGTYDCFLKDNTALPMMFMDDAINATVNLMDAKPEQVKIRSSYNLAAISFTPSQLAKSIQQHLPNFTISYTPDFRQQIAESWPKSINDAQARLDWGWKHSFDMQSITKEMLSQLQKKYQD